MQAARHIAEWSPIQEESILIPIHYEGPSVCLQRERLRSAEVCRSGGRRGCVGVCQEQRDGTTSSAECFVIFTLSPMPDLIRPHRRLAQSYLTWGSSSSSSITSNSSREGRQSGFLSGMALPGQSNCHVVDSWEGTSGSKEGRRPPQVARQLAWTLSPVTLLVCKILYILNQLYQRHLGIC